MRYLLLSILLCPFLIFAAEGSASYVEKQGTPRGNISLQPVYMEKAVDSTYVLGPGDFLDLFLENNYFSAQVNPDGSITIDECGSIDVGGKTFGEAQKIILEAVSAKYDVRYSYVKIAKLKMFKVSLMGAVAKSGQFIIETQTRLSTFIQIAGGFTPVADKGNIQIIRKDETVTINYDEMIRKGEFDKDIELQQGDRIFVPYIEEEKAVTFVLPTGGFSVPFQEGRLLGEYYLIGTGDKIENAAFKAIKIKSPEGEEKRLSLSEASRYSILAGTEIQCIGEGGTNEFVYVGGAVAAMGRVPYNPDYKALDYVAASGVTPITGSWDQVRVVRGNRETIDVNATEDVILPGDYIEIPKSTYETFKDFTMFLASLLTVLSSSFIIYMNYK